MDPRYPIGRFDASARATPKDYGTLIDRIQEAPACLREAVAGLNATQLDTPYRDDGWTVRQVVHHLPDSHLNAYIRFKLALTEDAPTIKPYDEAAWAELVDSMQTPIEASLALLDNLHVRWVLLLRAMTGDDFARPMQHPEIGRIDLEYMLRLYAWHGRHHVAHITSLRERLGW